MFLCFCFFFLLLCCILCICLEMFPFEKQKSISFGDIKKVTLDQGLDGWGVFLSTDVLFSNRVNVKSHSFPHFVS